MPIAYTLILLLAVFVVWYALRLYMMLPVYPLMDWLEQERRYFSALAITLLHSCTNPFIHNKQEHLDYWLASLSQHHKLNSKGTFQKQTRNSWEIYYHLESFFLPSDWKSSGHIRHPRKRVDDWQAISPLTGLSRNTAISTSDGIIQGMRLTYNETKT